MLQQRPRNQVLTEKEILAAVVSRLEKGSEAEEDQKNPQELQGGGANFKNWENEKIHLHFVILFYLALQLLTEQEK